MSSIALIVFSRVAEKLERIKQEDRPAHPDFPLVALPERLVPGALPASSAWPTERQ
jgi:hypothetical protein